MNKTEVIAELNNFKARLLGDVVIAYRDRGAEFGSERFNSWRRKLTNFLADHLPGQVQVLEERLTRYVYSSNMMDTDLEAFWKLDGETMQSYIESLIIDIQNDEYEFGGAKLTGSKPSMNIKKDTSKVFIVHGHDGEAKERTARFVEKLGFEAIILSEKPNKGKTIIEKIEEFSNVGFGIVLYTPDDKGASNADSATGAFKPRARQNVVFEHGFLMGKIGRSNVATLVTSPLELPNDISGVVYISDKDWQMDIAKEMKAAGYIVDFNKLV